MSGRPRLSTVLPCMLAAAVAASYLTGTALAAGPHAAPRTPPARPHLAAAGNESSARRSANTGSGGNLSVSVPVVLFGASDGLPATLTAGAAYDARVQVWVAGDEPTGSARVHGQPEVDTPSGTTTTIPATVRATAAVRVVVRVDGVTYTHTYRHTVRPA